MTPFGVVLIAAGVLVAVIQRRVRTTAGAARPLAPRAEGDPALRARLARELDDLDRN